MKRLLLILYIIIGALYNVQGRAASYKILATEQGLSSSLITYLYQDRHGMIWIGTEDGLNRYDGVKITTYHHKKGDPNSLYNNYIRSLAEDAKGNLIVSSYGGLQTYQYETDDFSTVALNEQGQPLGVSITDMVYVEDSLHSGKMYGTGDQFSQIEVNDHDHTVHIQSVPWDIPLTNAGEMNKDAQGNLWVHYIKALYHINTKQNKSSKINLPDLPEGSLDNVHNDGTGQIYLSSNATLFKVSEQGLKPLPSKSSLGFSTIRSILRLNTDLLLIGTDGEGIKLLNESNGEVNRYPLDIPEVSSDQMKVHRMMRDKEGNIWIGLFQKGVVMISQRSSQFRYIGSKVSQYDQIGNCCITALYQSHDGKIWVGTDGDGLYELSSEGQFCRHYTAQQVPQVINTIFEDSEGSLWTGSYGYPCYRKTKGKDTFEKFEAIKASTGRSACVFDICEDTNKHLWFATMGNGLFCYDLNTHQAIDTNIQDINTWQNCLLATTDGEVLVGTFDGIYAIDKGNDTARHFCSKQIVYSMYEDCTGQLWAGTAEGLVQFNLQGDSTQTWTTQEGLPSNSIYAIHSNGANLLWIATNRGLSCFDTQRQTFSNYSIGDGLQGNEFSKNTVTRHQDGSLWFGGNNGITYFNPDLVQRSNVKVEPRLNCFYLNNSAHPILDSTLLSFPYEDNSFSIEFAAKPFDAPQDLIYMYSINDGEWSSLPSGSHLVSFSNLASGRYQFKYLVSYDGRKSDVQCVTIEIQRPWWNSTWAHIIYTIGTLLLILFFIIWWRTHEKVKILALISHKIRTPMSLIISPLQQLIDEDNDPARQSTYQMMLRNAMKLQHLAAQATEEEPIGPIEIKRDTEETSDPKAVNKRTTWHLLIVEDDEDVRHYLRKELSRDFHIREARNGKEALELIFQRQPDAIISDVTMPEMDGISLCRKLKRNIQLSHIPVVLLTARADEKSKLQGLGIGADAYITKPFNILILRQEVINQIQLRQQLRNTFKGQQQQEERLKKIEVEDYDDKLMERIMNVINEHLSEPEFSIECLCEQVGISRAQLHRKLKENTNQSTSIFIRNVRLRQAEKLLVETNLRINEIAEKVGFKQDTYFINMFRDLYGMSPSEWRRTKTSKS